MRCCDPKSALPDMKIAFKDVGSRYWAESLTAW
jgi:hypothetical protein